MALYLHGSCLLRVMWYRFIIRDLVASASSFAHVSPSKTSLCLPHRNTHSSSFPSPIPLCLFSLTQSSSFVVNQSLSYFSFLRTLPFFSPYHYTLLSTPPSSTLSCPTYTWSTSSCWTCPSIYKTPSLPSSDSVNSLFLAPLVLYPILSLFSLWNWFCSCESC